MRVLFTVPTMNTHYLLMVPLAWAFRVAGHEVRVAIQPSGVATVKQSGMTAVPVARDFDYVAAVGRAMADCDAYLEPYLKGEKRSPEVVMKLDPEVRGHFFQMMLQPTIRLAEVMAEDLVPFADSWRPDLVVSDPLVLAGPLAAETVGAPTVHHLTGPAMLRRNRFPGSDSIVEQWPPNLTALFERYGAEPRSDFAARTVDPLTTRLQLPGVPNRLPIRYIPYNGPGEVPEWLQRPVGRPRVLVTWGGTTSQLEDQLGFSVPAVLKGLAELDLDVVTTIAAADRSRLGETPPGVRVMEDMPLHVLLPTCDVIVHHGGIGTLLTAAEKGVPQVVLGLGGALDEEICAMLLAGTGAGLPLAEQAPADEIAAAVSKVLADGAQGEAARALREEIHTQPAPIEVAAALEELV